MANLDAYLRAATRNENCASLALARTMGIADSTWRRWRNGPEFVAITEGAAGLAGRVTTRTVLRAHLDVHGEKVALGGRSALWALHGATDSEPCRTPLPLELILLHELRHRPRPGVRLRRCRTLLPGDIAVVHGWPCTTAAFTGMDLVARLDDHAALALLIDMVFHRLVTPAELVQRAQRTPTALGAARTERLATPLLAERSDSIFEWIVRRSFEAAGIDLEPGPQLIPTSDGTHSQDIVVKGRKVSVECNGGDHLETVQQARDGRKRNALLLDDWIPLGITYADFMADPSGFVAKVKRAIAKSEPRPGP